MDIISSILEKGGIMIIPLMLASLAALTIIIERALFLRRKKIIRPEVLSFIRHIDNLEELENSLKEIKKESGPFYNIIRIALRKRDYPRDEIKEAIVDQGRQEASKMELGLVVLETIAGIAPLMGLMGTVLGMIKVFQKISEVGLGQTKAFSAGISEALITTVVGPAIAIPLLIVYNYFTHRVEELILEIEKYSGEFLDRITEKR